MQYYLMLTFATLLLAVDFAVNKFYQKIKGTSPEAGLEFNCLLGLFMAIIFFVANGFKMSFTPFSFIMAAVFNVVVMSYNLIGFRLLKSGTMALYTLFLMTGGMVLPYIWGLVFLDEPFSVLRTVGLLFIIVGVVIANFDGEKANKKQILMCVAVFVINGISSIISKEHQTELNYACVGTTEFVILGGLFKFAFAGILRLFVKNEKKEKTQKKSAVPALLAIAASALVSGISYFMQLLGATQLPATVLYPFITGGTIIFSAIAGIVVFKEKVSFKVLFSIAMCFIGTLLFL